MDPLSIAYLNQCYDLLPPFIRAVERKGSTVYLNDITGDFNSSHPLDRYKAMVVQTEDSSSPNGDADDDAQIEESHPVSDEHSPHLLDFEPLSDSFPKAETPTTTKSEAEQLLEYHCQWKERNAFGQMSMYGLTLRFDLSNGTTSVRFDGVANSDWTFTALKGPYGALEPHDLYVGAKVQVFGRHLTISTANSAAVRWIEREAKRLNNLQAKFRKRIESVGQKPIVIAPKPEVVRHVERENKKAGQINMRKLLTDVSKLGEQLANLGLAEFALS